MSNYLRDRMATGVYHLIVRHIESINRSDHEKLDKYFIDNYVNDSFEKLKWKHDVFDAEFLTKRTEADFIYEETVQILSCLRLDKKVMKETALDNREWVLKKMDLEKNDVVLNMRKRFYNDF